MEHKRIVEMPAAPATTREETYKTTCDLCGATIHDTACGDVDEVEVKRSKGSRYPDGTWLDVTTVDMCGGCFETKLVPWLKSQGIEPRTEEVSW